MIRRLIPQIMAAIMDEKIPKPDRACTVWLKELVRIPKRPDIVELEDPATALKMSSRRITRPINGISTSQIRKSMMKVAMLPDE